MPTIFPLPPDSTARQFIVGDEIDTLIGVYSDYLPPENPGLVIDTEELAPAEAVDAIIKFTHQTGWDESKQG